MLATSTTLLLIEMTRSSYGTCHMFHNRFRDAMRKRSSSATWIDVDTPEAHAEAERLLDELGEDLSGTSRTSTLT